MIENVRRCLLGLGLVSLTVVLAAVPAVAAPTAAPPTAPANLHVDAVGLSHATLAWDPATTGTPFIGYELTVTSSATGHAMTTSTTYTSLSAFPLPSGTLHTASVRTVDGAGNRSAAATVSFTTSLSPDGPAPTRPANLRGVYVAGVLHSIAWDPSVGAQPLSYALYSFQPGLEHVSVWATATTSVTVHDLVHVACLDRGSTHTFTVIAGWAQGTSEHSFPLTVTLPPTV
jgi:Fibronectin type III domain